MTGATCKYVGTGGLGGTGMTGKVAAHSNESGATPEPLW